MANTTKLLAQSAGTYVFTKTTGNFTPVSSMTTIVSGDEVISTLQNIGFTFNYAGVNYTTYKVSTNGFINLGGNLTSALFFNQINSTTNHPIIAPLWDDLISTVVAEVTGMPGNQVLTVEWRNVKWRYNAASAGFTFQAKLYEADGKIEFVYGDSTAASNTPTASIGLNSSPGGIGNFLSVDDLGNSASNSTAYNSIAIWPGLNTVYVFQKPAVGPPVPDFFASNVTPGVGENVTLTDASVANPPATAWTWTITPNTFTYVSGTNQNSQNPVVQFTQMGLYTVKLVVTNPIGTDSITKVNYINVGYCTAGATSTFDTDIGQFTFGTFVNGSATPVTNNPAANGTYSDFTTLDTIQVYQNSTYPMSVSHITSGSTFYPAYIKVYIDYNQNGVFEAGEVVLEGGTTQSAPTISGNVFIPPTASLGFTRLRVVQREGGNTSTTQPCGTFTYGEVEDYTVEILPSLPCNNPPIAGTASVNPSTVFPGDPVYLNLTGYSGSVQWQYSTDSINFINISGANTVPDTLYAGGLGTFYIRALVFTPNCPPDSSNIVTINVVPRTGDLPSNPKLITTNTYTDTDSTYGYTNNYTGPNNQPSNDIFYQYIVPSCIDSININTCATTFDSYIHVLRNGTHVASNDDGCGGIGVGSKIILNSTQYAQGDTLLIVVEGWSNTQGTYTLNFTAYSSAPAAPTAMNDTICKNTSATLTAAGTGTILWYDVPSGGSSIGTGSTFSTPLLDTTTTYYVEAVAGACTSTRVPVTVYVTDVQAPTAMNDTICVGDSTTLMATGSGNISWYSDSLGTNLIGSGPTFSTSALFADTTFYLQSELNGCYSSIVPVSVTVNMPGMVTPNVPDTVMRGQPFTVSATGGLTYLWVFGPGAIPDSASGPGPHTVVMNIPGIWFIKLYYTVECGGPGLDSLIIPIYVDPGTSVNNPVFHYVNLYPNPNHGSFQFTATLMKNSNVTLEIYNSLGQNVYSRSYQDVNVIREHLHLNLPAGIYTYQLISHDAVHSGKFVVD
jgi:hypothetical protein